MAQPEKNMAEVTSGSGTEGSKLYIASNSGAVVGEHRVGSKPLSDEEKMADAIAKALSRSGEAGRTPKVERREMPPSYFKTLIAEIRTLEQQAPSPDRDTRLENARRERDQLRYEVNGYGWLNPAKEELFDLYLDSRVKVDRDQKLGSDDWRRRSGGAPGRLELLKNLEQAAAIESWEGNWFDEDRGSRGFWDSSLVQTTLVRLQSQGVQVNGHLVTKQDFINRYGGIMDDFVEESRKMIRAVVVNRHMFEREGLDEVREKYHLISDDYYRNNGLASIDQDGNGLWNFVWTSEHNRKYFLRNFDDVRDRVEHERKKKYFIPNYGDYESYIKLVADDVEEVEECIPYILSVFKSKFGTGDPNKVNEEIEQETRKLNKALEKFQMDLGYERELPEYSEFRRLLSGINHHINLLQNYEFSELAFEDWQPYLQSGAKLGRGFHDTEYQDSIPDAVLLDKDGLMMLAMQEFERNDGEYWRYGSNNADTPKYMKEGDAREWQEKRKEQMKEYLMRRQLRTMFDLLNMDRDGHSLGDPAHPAFQRLKAKFDELDRTDRDVKKIPLVDSYGKPMTRWEEYCEKAMAWQKNQTITEELFIKDKNGRNVIRRVFPIGDVRDYRQRVLFQHPLARALTEEEFNLMYEDVDENDPIFRKGRDEKERKINSLIGTTADLPGSAERMARAFQEDAAAGLARHTLSFEQMRAIGLIAANVPQNFTLDGEGFPLDPNGQRIPREVLHYAVDFDGKPILKDGKLIPEAVPHKVLLKHLCQMAMKYDWEGVEGNLQKQRTMRFKLSYVMQKMGIPRSLPLFSNWYLGANDTIRPNWLPEIEKALPGFALLMADKRKVRELDSDDEFGGDEKTVTTRAVEDEREFVELMEMYIRDQFPTYFNYPGQDTRGGGNKEARNLFLLPYGQSRGTVEMNGMIPHIWLGETDFLRAYGCDNWREFIGIYKGTDEVDYKAMGSLFETPRDAVYWFRRVGAIIEQQKLWISDTEKGKAVLNAGWGSGFFQWRALNRAARFVHLKKEHEITDSEEREIRVNQFTTIADPDAAYKQLDQATYESYVKLAFQFLTPLIAIFEARQKLENVYGRSPGTAKFLNTMTWLAVSRWMDTNWEEFRGKYGNALDVNLHMARKFIHTALYESRLIFSDDEIDQRMLGYTIPQAEWNNIKDTNWNDMPDEDKKAYRPIIKVISYELSADGKTVATKDIIGREGQVLFKKGQVIEGERIAGLIDRFPPDLRKVILDRHNDKDKSWILPMGLNSEYPETLGAIKELAKRGEHRGMRQIYMSLLEPRQFKRQTRQRIPVTRNAA